jgi:hypothetical protein
MKVLKVDNKILKSIVNSKKRVFKIKHLGMYAFVIIISLASGLPSLMAGVSLAGYVMSGVGVAGLVRVIISKKTIDRRDNGERHLEEVVKALQEHNIYITTDTLQRSAVRKHISKNNDNGHITKNECVDFYMTEGKTINPVVIRDQKTTTGKGRRKVVEKYVYLLDKKEAQEEVNNNVKGYQFVLNHEGKRRKKDQVA